MFWTHWKLSALRSFYGLAASASQTEFRYLYLSFHCDEPSGQFENPTKRPSFFLPTYAMKIKPAKFKSD
jgi:hypothetical protein